MFGFGRGANYAIPENMKRGGQDTHRVVAIGKKKNNSAFVSCSAVALMYQLKEAQVL